MAFTRRSIKTGTGVADAVASQGDSVWGVAYELDEAGFGALDSKEGRGWAYERVPVLVHLEGGGEPTEAVTYRVLNPEPTEVTPSQTYLDALVEAARERGLPSSYIDFLEQLRHR